MANWSTTVIDIWSDNSKNISDAQDYLINNCIQDDWLDGSHLMPDDSIESRSLYNGGTIIDKEFTGTSINFILEGRWCGPSGLFCYICETYNLSGFYIDREPGADFTHVVEYMDGTEVVNQEDDYISALSFKHMSLDEMFEDVYWALSTPEGRTENPKLLLKFMKLSNLPLEDIIAYYE